MQYPLALAHSVYKASRGLYTISEKLARQLLFRRLTKRWFVQQVSTPNSVRYYNNRVICQASLRRMAGQILMIVLCNHSVLKPVLMRGVYVALQTDEEFEEIYFVYSQNANYTNAKVYHPLSSITTPDSMDWRTKGAVSSIKNQVCV